MAKESLSSKLAVILHADIAGSTTLVQQDEHLAHERIQDAFRRFGSTIEIYQGHVLELRGDALLAEFERPSDAVAATLAFQADHAYQISHLKDDLRPTVRVGIAMGEVIIADATITGAGVILAQRIEQLAEPGGLCVTAALHEALPKRLPFDLENLGNQELKGFDDPVHVYRIELRPGKSIPPPEPLDNVQKLTVKWKQIGVGTVVFVLIVVVSLYWLTATKSMEHAVVALPDKPSIAVMPFTNMSSDTEQEYFADGMTEDLITDLSKLSGLFVISRNSVFTYKGKAVKIQQVAEELGVRYILEGSIRRVGNQVRVNAQLIDATTDGHIWADRYDGTYEDVFSLQDKVSNKIVSTLAITLTQDEQDQILQRETDNTEAYDTFLKGWQQYLRQTPESYQQAITLFNQAIELDPEYSRVYAALSLTYWQAWKNYLHTNNGYFHPPHQVRYEAETHLALAMEKPTSLALQVSSAMHAQFGRHEQAIAEGERAIAMDPNAADGYVALAGALNLAGHPERALLLMERAMRLNPHYPTSYLHELGLARFGMEEYEKAAIALERAMTLAPDDRSLSRLLIATLGQLDRASEAMTIIDRVGSSLGFDLLSVRAVAYWYPYKNPVDAERLASGLRKAGVAD